MRTSVIVVDPPALDLMPSVGQIGEPVLVQTLVAELAVEALDERILYGLAWPNEMKLHPYPVGPRVERLARELGAVVYDDAVGLTSFIHDSIQNPHDPLSRQRAIHLDRRALATEIIDDGQCPEGAAIDQSVGHEIHRPAFVHAARCGKRLTRERSHAASSLPTNGQALGSIQPLHSFVVHDVSFASQQ